MVPRTAYPPAHHHPRLTKSLSPAEAQNQLASFLAKTQHNPYLHPDALISTSGISYSAQSGPNGGLAINHLKRIEAGLRGENLVAETQEDLFQYTDGLPGGDDTRIYGLIEDTASARRKQDGLGKRKRSKADVAQWADESSEAAFGDWQEMEEYAQEQRPLEGEMGEREGAPAVRQNGAPPTVLQHDAEGGTRQPMTREDKAARKAAKRARGKARKEASGYNASDKG